jgi:bromodomain adjacent to zinc finger domain protein 1A
MKRYLRECLMRDPAIGSPWMVKPSIAVAFGIPTDQSEGEEERNRKLRDGQLAKRRKTGGEESTPAPSKKRKSELGCFSSSLE